jgi:HEAT repeat protein
MKRLLYLTVTLGLLLSGLQFSARAAQTNEEQRLIGVLRSDHSPAEKDAACAQLKRVGTARSVPALAALLTDEQLSHSARYALESMATAKAGQALAEALGKTSGMTQVGIINSLGYRRETRAVSALSKLLTDHDAHVVAAAATALGQIGDSKALKALQATTANSAGPIHDALVDGCLRCANRLLASGKPQRSLEVFQQLYDNEPKDSIRTAAFRGMILASGDKALPLMIGAIMGSDGASQIAALQLVREVPGSGATTTFAALLHRVDAPVQVALIEGLVQRGDILATPGIVAMVTSAAPEARLAAIHALGILGDATTIPLLGVSAASANGEEQKAARLALIQLRRGNPTETLLRLLPAAKPEVQAEFARALGGRGDKSAVPKLVEVVRADSDTAGKAALQALALLVDDSQLGLMVQFVVEAKSDTARSDAAEALNSACRQIQARHGRVDVAPVVQGLAAGSTEARIALLPVCSGLIDARIREGLRAATADPQIRAAAIRALCDTSDPALLPDLLKLACEAPEANLRTLAIRACVRLTTQEETIKLSGKEQIEPLKAILATTLSADQKRVVLAGLAEILDLQALNLAEPMLAEAAIQLEAAKTVTKIASALPYAQTEAAVSSLKKVVAVTTDADTRKAAETALKDIQSGADYITAWQIAGPYLQEGKEYKDLFDIAFPPETAKPQGVKWQAATPGTDTKLPWVMDLLKALGGEQRVAYARTWIHSDQPQPAQLELGTDDGVKVWLNRDVVHTNNIFRGLQPDSDKVKVTLKAGWNPLLLKVTQLNAGWAFCARFRKPDGSRLDGLQFAAQPPKPAAGSPGK